MAENINQKINVDADLKGMDDFVAAATKSTKAATNLAGALGKLNQAGKGNPTQQLNQGLNNIANSATKASSSVKKTSSSLTQVGKKAQTAGASLNTLSTQMTRLTRITFIQFFLRQFFEFQRAVTESIQGAGEFERALAEIRTISGDAKLSFEEMNESLSRISENIGAPRIELAAAAYQALSAQVADTSNVFTLVDTAAKLATATLSTTKEATDALASVMNSFGATAGSVESIAGKLFKTIELGRIRMGELSKVIGRVAPLAAELGVSLDETLAGLAALTLSGVNAAEAGTLLSNVMLKLIKPSEALSDVYAELGVQSGEVLIAQEGFQGALQKIVETGGDSSQAVGELFGRIRALRAALSLTGKQADEFNTSLAKIKAAGAKDLQEAFEEIKATNFQELQRNVQKLTNTIQDTFGVTMLNAVNKFFSLIGGADQIVNTMVLAFIAGGGVILATWVTYMGGVSAAIIGVQVVALEAALTIKAAFLSVFSPAGAVIVAVTAVTAIVAKMFLDASQESERFVKNQKQQLSEIAKNAETAAKELAKSRQEAFGEDLQSVLKLADKANAVIGDQIESAKVVSNVFRNDLGKQIDDKIKKIFDVVDGVRKVAIEARDALANLPKLQQKVQQELRDFDFEVSLEKVEDKVAQANKLLQESSRRRTEAFSFSQRGLEKEADAAYEAAVAYAERARSLASTAGAKGQTALNTAINAQRQLIKDQIQLETQLQQARLRNAGAAGKIAGELNLIGGAAEHARDRLLELSKEEVKGVSAARAAAIAEERNRLNKILEAAFKASGPKVAQLANLGFAELADSLAVTPEIFNPLNNAIDNVAAASQRATEVTANFIKQQVQQLDPILQGVLKELNIEVTVEGIPLVKQQLNDLKKELAELAGTSAQYTAAVDTLNETQKNTATSVSELDTLYSNLGKTATRTYGTENFQAIKTAIDDVKTAYDSFNQAVSTGDLEGARQAALGFEEAWKNAADANIPKDFLNAISAVSAGIKQQVDALAVTTNKQFQEVQVRVDTIQRIFGLAAAEIAKTPEAIAKAGEAGATVGSQIASGVAPGITAMQDLKKAAEEAAKAVAAAGSGGASKSWFGGLPVYRQAGGLTRGLDTTLVAMNPNEMVMTASATRKNFPALSAANSGVTPVFRQQGGTVHNEIGNISVSVTEAVAPRSTAREVVAEIKREMRRGTTFI